MSFIKSGSKFLVNTVTDDYQESPSLTTLSNGNFVASWHSNTKVSGAPSPTMDIFAQIFKADGTKVGGEFLVNTYTTGQQAYSVLAALSNGGFVVSWQSANQASTPGNDVYVQIFNANGVKVNSELLVNTYTTGEQQLPTLASLSNGGFVVSWYSGDPSNSDIYAQRFNANGDKVGGELLVNTFTLDVQNAPTLAALSDGGFVISWQSFNQVSSSSHYDIYAQRFNANGDKVGNEFLVNTFTDKEQRLPTMAGLSNGGFVVSWYSNPGTVSSDYDIYAQIFDANSDKVGSEFLVNTFTTGSQNTPTLAALSDGGFVVSWQSNYQVSGSTQYAIYAQAFSANGDKLGNELLVDAVTTPDLTQPAITALSDGGFVVSWRAPGVSQLDIYAQRFISTTPRLSLTQSTLSFTEDGAPVALDSGLTVIDADSTTLAYATVTISTGLVAGEDELLFSNQNGISGSYANGVLSLNGIASLADYQTALRSVRYRNTNNQNPSTGARTISITVNDGVEDSNTVSLGLSVVAVNDAPIITTSNGSVSFTEKGAAIVIDSGLTVSDVDSAQLTRASVAITVGYVLGEDELLFTAQNGISGSFDVSSGILTLTGVSSVANYQAALRSVTYINTSEHPDTQARTISFIVNDGQADSPAANRSVHVIAVNNAPVITTSSGSVSFTEKGAAVIIDNGLTVSDVDNTQLVNATASISQGFVTQEDELGFTALAGIAGHYDSQQGMLSLTGIANSNDYQTVLRSVTYRNRNTVNPHTQPRTVEFVVNDGALTSAAANRTVTVIAVNDAPVLVNNRLTISQAQTVVLSTNELSASDDTTPTNSLQFTVSNMQHGEFHLMGVAATRFTQQDILEGKVSFVHDGTATAPSYTVRVSDDDLTSAPQTASIIFNRMPILSSGNQTISYYSRTAPVIIDSQLSIQADDSPTLTRATVSISQGLVPAEDELSVITPASLSAVYEPTTGVLQLTGNATIADYQQTLRQVAYRSQADVPTTHSRTISFSVFDGLLTSQPVNCSLSVIQVNRAPLLINPRAELAVRVNQPFSLNLADTFRDPDHDELTLGLLPTDGQALPDWLNFDASRQILSGKASTPGSYNFTLFANDTAHAQARMPMTLVAKVVTNNALILGTALGLGLSGSLVLLCCLGILVTAGVLGVGYERKLSQQQALSRKPHRLADLLRKELRLQGVADFTKPTGQAYVNQVNYLITYDEVLFQLYIRCSNDKQLPSLAKELAKLIKLHFKEQKIELQANLLQKETPKMMLSFHQQEAFFTAALNRAGYQDLLAAPIELKEIETQRELNPH